MGLKIRSWRGLIDLEPRGSVPRGGRPRGRRPVECFGCKVCFRKTDFDYYRFDLLDKGGIQVLRGQTPAGSVPAKHKTNSNKINLTKKNIC